LTCALRESPRLYRFSSSERALAPRGVTTERELRAAGELDVDDGDGRTEGDEDGAAPDESLLALQHEDARRRQEQQQHRVPVGDPGPCRLAAVVVEPVGHPQEEARLLLGVGDLERLRV